MHSLINLLENESDQFSEAQRDYDIAHIIKKYEENPIHLKFMAGCPFDIVCENCDDEDFVKIGLNEYDVDEDEVRGSIESDWNCVEFDNITGRYDDPYDDSHFESNDEEMGYHAFFFK